MSNESEGTPQIVSVVTPTLNAGDRLKRCLRSVRDQTYPHVEHIVIDGGSTDGSLEELENTDVRWVSEQDSGQTAAINKGLGLARGEVLTWLNADDSLAPAAAEAAVSALKTTPTAGWVYGNLEVTQGDDRKIVKPPRRLSFKVLSAGNRVNQPGTFFTKSALDRVGGTLDEEFDLTMDFDLWLRFLGAGAEPVYIDQVLASFEVHADSKTGRVSLAAFAEEEARAFYKHGLQQEAAVAYGRAAAYATVRHGRVKSQQLEIAILRYLKKYQMGEGAQRALRAAAQVQAGLEELKTTPLGVRHLLKLNPWIVAPSRRRLFASLGRRICSRHD